ncbi:MAG: hypothetical protein O8C66_15930 [Candidatus Methanoperedens sp.]|nr:hypothetical protein [Candidatus Methanoperedens sp.]MCZ7371985.1 hypothetical protein [Candidatus Methanoperedens sp.]
MTRFSARIEKLILKIILAVIGINIEETNQKKEIFLDRIGWWFGGIGWFVPQRIKCVC